MKYYSLLSLSFFLLTIIPSAGLAEDTIERQFVCSEKLRMVKNRTFKGGMCKSAALLALAFFNDVPTSQKIIECQDGYEECLTQLNSKKWGKTLRRATNKCKASASLPPYTCALPPEIVSNCVDNLSTAFRKMSKHSCEKLVATEKVDSKSTEGQSASCTLIKDTCPEVMDALNLSKL